MITIRKSSDKGVVRVPNGLSRIDTHFHADIGTKKVTVTTLGVRAGKEPDVDPLAAGLTGLTRSIVDIPRVARLRDWETSGTLPTNEIGLEFKKTLADAGILTNPHVLINVKPEWDGKDTSKLDGFMIRAAYAVSPPSPPSVCLCVCITDHRPRHHHSA